MFGSEVFIEQATDCVKEIALYTPSGAVVLSNITSFLPQEVTHLSVIVGTPFLVLWMKHFRQKHERRHQDPQPE